MGSQIKLGKTPLFLFYLLSLIGSYLVGYLGNPDTKDSVIVPSESSGRDLSLPQDSLLPEVSGPVCSHDFLREHYKSHGYYPGSGKWVATSGSKVVNETFSPQLCKFRWSEAPHAYVRDKMEEKGVNSIVVIGDSNSKEFHRGIVRYFSEVYESSCTLYTGGNQGSEIQPFKRCLELSNSINSKQFPNCGNGLASNVCRKQDGSASLIIEHIGLMSIYDSKVSKFTSVHLRTYLKRRQPSVILFFPPFNHLGGSTLTRLKTGLANIRSIFDQVFQRNSSTKVYFMPGFREFKQRHLRLSIDDMNHALFLTMKSELVSMETKRYGFIDLVEVSKSRESWTRDGVHMYDEWYWVVANMLVQLLLEGD